MSSELGMVGDLATSALVAQAVEPDHGAQKGATGGNCLNCAMPLIGAYCHGCGQNSHIHRTIGGFAHDLLHGVFHFDGKFWATLPMLLFKPGALTRRYIAGERAKFISPLALFLFCVFVMFAVLGNLPSSFSEDVTVNTSLSVAEMDRKIADERHVERDLLKQIRAAAIAGHSPRRLERQREKIRTERHGYEHARDRKLREQGLPMRADHPSVTIDERLSVAQMTARIAQDRNVEEQMERAIQADARAGRDIADAEYRLERIKDDRFAYMDARKAKQNVQSGTSATESNTSDLLPWLKQVNEEARANPGLFIYRLQSSAYKYCWLLIPLSTPLLWLLFFWKRQYKAYDHLVFVTFSLSTMMLLVTLLSIGGALGLHPALITLVVAVVPPLHMYKQLRGAYQIGRVSALLRTGALIVMAGIALLAYLLALLAMGVMH